MDPTLTFFEQHIRFSTDKLDKRLGDQTLRELGVQLENKIARGAGPPHAVALRAGLWLGLY